MKYLSILFLTILLLSCSNEKETVTVITNNDASELYDIAETFTSELLNRLGGRLVEVIQNEGVIEAIDVCYKEAYEITDELADEIDEVKSIKRVTNKFRNPKNAPDAYEVDALRWFEEQYAKGTKPTSFGQKITKRKGDLIRYYKPMYVQNKCLLCHGKETDIMPEIAKKINNLYPDDLAKNYNEGDFRGLVRVELKRKPL